MVISLLVSWNEIESKGEANLKGQRTWEGLFEQNRQHFVMTHSVYDTKELSRCYVSQNETFMSKPSSHSQPIGTVHEWPIWWVGHYLKLIYSKREHFERFNALGSYQTQGKGTTFIGMNGKDHVLPEQLRLCSNLKENYGEGCWGEGRRWRTERREGGGGHEEERRNEKRDRD